MGPTLFNGALSLSVYISSTDGIVCQQEIRNYATLSGYSLICGAIGICQEVYKETTICSVRHSSSPVRDLNLGSPKYKAEGNVILHVASLTLCH
jgi:hypothetical protein